MRRHHWSQNFSNGFLDSDRDRQIGETRCRPRLPDEIDNDSFQCLCPENTKYADNKCEPIVADIVYKAECEFLREFTFLANISYLNPVKNRYSQLIRCEKIFSPRILTLTGQRPIKPILPNFRVWRVIAKEWRDEEPIKIAQIYAKPTLYNSKEVLILKKNKVIVMDETWESKFRLKSVAHYPYIITLWVSRPS